jgi:hypothetical protein
MTRNIYIPGSSPVAGPLIMSFCIISFTVIRKRMCTQTTLAIVVAGVSIRILCNQVRYSSTAILIVMTTANTILPGIPGNSRNFTRIRGQYLAASDEKLITGCL